MRSWQRASASGDRDVLPQRLTELGRSWPTSAPRPARVLSRASRRLDRIAFDLRSARPGEAGPADELELVVRELDQYWSSRTALPPECSDVMSRVGGSSAGRRPGPAELLADCLVAHWEQCDVAQALDTALPSLVDDLSRFWVEVCEGAAPASESVARFQEIVQQIDDRNRRRRWLTAQVAAELRCDLARLVDLVSGKR